MYCGGSFALLVKGISSWLVRLMYCLLTILYEFLRDNIFFFLVEVKHIHKISGRHHCLKNYLRESQDEENLPQFLFPTNLWQGIYFIKCEWVCVCMYHSLCVCVRARVCAHTHVSVYISSVSPLLPPCGFWDQIQTVRLSRRYSDPLTNILLVQHEHFKNSSRVSICNH